MTRDDRDPLRAVGTFVWEDPGRILAVASRLRAARGVIAPRLRGGSMGDAIPFRSRIRIELDGDQRYRTGQVVAYLAGSRLMVHRVVYRGRILRSRRYMITQGDALGLPDPPVPISSVLGAVLEFERDGRWVGVGAGPRRSWKRRLVSLAVRGLLGVALEIDVRLARWVLQGLGTGWRWLARVSERRQRPRPT